jgi:hypothetical protein
VYLSRNNTEINILRQRSKWEKYEEKGGDQPS